MSRIPFLACLALLAGCPATNPNTVADGGSPVPDKGPEAVVGADQTVASGATVKLDGSGSIASAGKPITSYAWSQLSGPQATLSGASTDIATFVAPITSAAVKLVFQLTVGDGTVTGTAQTTVTVNAQAAENLPPTAAIAAPASVLVGAAVTLDGSGSSDPNGYPLTYQWTQTGGTSVTLSSSTAAKPTFTAPGATTTLAFSLVVTDSHGLASPAASASVNVLPAGSTLPPEAVAGASQSVSSGATVTLDGSGSSDPNGYPLTYLWTQTGGTSVALSSATAVKPTFTAPGAAATLIFSLVVTDSHSLVSSPATTTVTVTAPAAASCSGVGSSTNDFLKEPSLHALTRTGVVVFFMTASSVVAKVAYGSGNLSSTATDPSATGRHVIQLSGLTANTAYSYQVTAGSSSATGCFMTAPDYATSPTAFRFAVGGDSRGNDTEWTKVANAILAKNPRFYMATGDNNNSNGAASAWQTYYKDAATLLRNVPYFAAMGNHDNYSSWSTYNVSPQSSSGSDSYYAMVFGNAGFVAINPNASYASGTAQNSWVSTALSTFKGGPLFAFQHQPLYSCGSHGSDTTLQAAFQSMFEQNLVATSFNGHDHDLIFWSTVNGVRYVVSGGGGTSLYSLSGCQGPFSVSGYGFMIVDVDGASVTETFYDDSGNQLFQNPTFSAAGTAIDFSKIGSLTVY